MLELADITFRFGGFTAVDRASLAVGEGEIVGLIGPNGAGKSTLFAVATGFLPPAAGTVRWRGRDITALAPEDRCALGLARSFQVPREFTHLPVRDNLAASAPAQSGERVLPLFLAPWRVRRDEARVQRDVDEVLATIALDAVADMPAGKISGGQRKLLELGRALMTRPALMLLDEPFGGVNPVLIEAIARLIRRLNREQGIAFLIVEHNLRALAALAGRLAVMDRGRIIASGGAEEVLREPDVRAAYLGGA